MLVITRLGSLPSHPQNHHKWVPQKPQKPPAIRGAASGDGTLAVYDIRKSGEKDGSPDAAGWVLGSSSVMTWICAKVFCLANLYITPNWTVSFDHFWVIRVSESIWSTGSRLGKIFRSQPLGRSLTNHPATVHDLWPIAVPWLGQDPHFLTFACCMKPPLGARFWYGDYRSSPCYQQIVP